MSVTGDPYPHQVTLKVTDTGIEISNWTEYSFNSNYLIPADKWTLSMSGPLGPKVANAIQVGTRVSLEIDGKTQATGRVDKATISSSRQGGTTLHVEGRDSTAILIDPCMDPVFRLQRNMSLEDIVKAIVSPYGFDSIVDTNDANRNAITGGSRGYKRVTKKGKSVKSQVAHEIKPYPKEGVFQFLTRICHRFGLWPKIDCTGKYIIVSTPDFDQPAMMAIQHYRDEAQSTQNNFLRGSCARDGTDQPTYIVAEGRGGGAEFGYAKAKVFALNPCVQLGTDDLSVQTTTDIINKYSKDSRYIKLDPMSDSYLTGVSRPMFLRDDESKNQDELECFVRKELALKMRKSFEYECTVRGHVTRSLYGSGGTKIPWAIDTIVNVDDDVFNVHEPLWILDRTFKCSRQNGYETDLKLLRKYSMTF